MNKKLIEEYTIKIEECSMNETDPPVTMHSVYAGDGGYCGPVEEFGKYLAKGILPEKSAPDHNTCSIGKSYLDGKWYGWSHRAMFGFEIGSVIKEGDCAASSGYTEEWLKENPEQDRSLPVGFTAKTEDDCKKMAIAFADSVS